MSTAVHVFAVGVLAGAVWYGFVRRIRTLERLAARITHAMNLPGDE